VTKRDPDRLSARRRGTLAGCRRLAKLVVAPVVVALVAAVGVLAYFTSHGSGSASASTGTFTAATISAPSSVTTPSVTITWSVQAAMTPSSANSGITYTVQRQLNGGGYSALSNGGCSGSLAYNTASCTDTLPSSPTTGTYSYQVVAHYHTWTATSNAVTVTANLDQTPPSTTISSPVNGTSYSTSAFTAGCAPAGTGICGTASDSGLGNDGVTAVGVSIRNGAGKYWDGSGFTLSSETFQPVTSGGTASGSGAALWFYSFTPPADGSYTIDVKATDGAGNSTQAGSYTSATFTYDTTPPAISREVLADGPSSTAGFITQGGSYYAYAQVTDTGGSGVGAVSADLHTTTTGATSVAMSSSAGPWTIGGLSYNYRSTLQTANASLPESGNPYSFTINASDNVANSSSANGSVKVDDTAPATTDNTGTLGNGWFKTNQTVTLSPSDGSGSGVASTYYTSGSPTAATPTTSSTQGTSVALNGDGLWQVKYFSTDKVGNSETVETAGTVIRIDETSPTAPAVVPSGATYTNGGGTVYIRNGVSLTDAATDSTVNGASSGVASVQYLYCSGSSCTPSTSIGTSSSGPGYSVAWSSQPADGTYRIAAKVTDNAGNSATSTPVTVVIDNTPPATTDNSSTIGNGWKKSSQTVTLSPSDSGSGVANTYYTTDGSTPTTSSSMGTSVSLTSDGLYTIKYFSKDNVGNPEAVETAGTQIRIDTTNPTAGEVVTSGAYVNGATTYVKNGQAFTDTTTGDPTVNGASSGVASVQYLYCSGSSCTPSTSIGTSSSGPGYSVAWSSQPADGTYRIAAKVTDNAGNSATSTPVTVVVDNSGPTGSVTSPTANSTVQGTATVASSNAADAGSGLASVQFQYTTSGGSSWTNIGSAVTGSPWQASLDTTSLTNGSYDFRAVMVDNLGNSTTTATVASVTVNNTYSLSISNPAATNAVTAGSADTNAITVQLQLNGAGTGTYKGSAYAGNHAVSFSGSAMNAAPDGTTATPTSQTLSFNSSGQATIAASTFTFYAASSTAILTATDSGNSVAGTSVAFTISAGSAANYAWTSVTKTAGTLSTPCLFTCTDTGLGNNQSISAGVSITDAHGNIVSGIGSGHTVTITISQNQSNGSFTAPSTTQSPVTLTFPSTGAATTGSFTYKASNSGNWTDKLTATTPAAQAPPTYSTANMTLTKQ
jgi:hypothetical protein